MWDRLMLLSHQLKLLGYHFVLELPASTSRQLPTHLITVAKQLDVKVNMLARLARDVDVRHMVWQVVWMRSISEEMRAALREAVRVSPLGSTSVTNLLT